MWWLCIASLAIGCGRIGFDAVGRADGNDSAMIDSHPMISGRHWVQRMDSQPGALFSPRLTYDSKRQTVLLYGGDTDALPTYALSGAMWELTSSGWQTLCNPCMPAPRIGGAFAYDPVRDRVVLYGGTQDGTTFLSDQWEWDGTTWSFMAVLPTNPGQRTDAQFQYDPVRQKLVMIGGFTASGLTSDVFEYDSATGTWTHPTPAGGPPTVCGNGAELTYDALAHHMVVLADNDMTDTDRDEVWIWDGTSWTLLCSACTGEGRASASLVADASTSTLYIINGYTDITGNSIGGTWQMTTSWTQISVDPPARDSSGVAYDAARDTFVLYGGNGDACTGLNKNCDETWELVPD